MTDEKETTEKENFESKIKELENNAYKLQEYTTLPIHSDIRMNLFMLCRELKELHDANIKYWKDKNKYPMLVQQIHNKALQISELQSEIEKLKNYIDELENKLRN